MKFGRKGEDHPGSKLSEYDVLAVRAYYNLGFTTRQIGDVYGVSAMTISRIVRRVHNGGWRHV